MKGKLLGVYQGLIIISGFLVIISFYLGFLNLSKIFMLIFLVLFAFFLLYLSLGLVESVKKEDTQYFKNVMFKLHNDFLPAIRTSLIDKNGDITNYSLNNEIVQIQIDLNYVFV